MSVLRQSLTTARLEWLDDDVPRNIDFDDVYFNTDNGINASEFVYCHANDLDHRMAQANSLFSIGETGFGTGLNFLLACRAWRRSNTTTAATLHYFSVENRPLDRKDLQRVLALFPELKTDAEELLERYPALVPGFHTIHFSGRITLHLMLGDASEMLSQLRDTDRPTLHTSGNKVDVWFLDGFAPRSNPDAWTPELLQLIAELSQIGTTFSTFTAATEVRRTLEACGFSVEKHTGFGGKREMSSGHFVGRPNADKAEQQRYKRNKQFPAASWYLPSQPQPHASCSEQTAIQDIGIIGAGLAGSTTAAALQRRGFSCTVYDTASMIASGGSGNTAAALYTRLSEHASVENDLALHSYLYASRYYDNYTSSHLHAACGLLQLIEQDGHAKAARLVEQLGSADILQLLTAKQASQRCGVHCNRPALFFPRGLAINIAQLCQQLLRESAAKLQLNTTVTGLRNTSNGVALLDQQQQQIAKHSVVIVCAGPHSKLLEQLSWMPTQTIRGQTSQLPATPRSEGLSSILCDESYMTPNTKGFHSIGASYGLGDSATDIRNEEHLANVNAAENLLADANAESLLPDGVENMQGWAALRCASTDYLPIVGPVPKRQEFERVFAKLRNDKNLPIAARTPYWPNLYVNTAYGSRGLCFAPLCAEVLARQISGEFSPLPAPMRHALLPARFIVRNITRSRVNRA